MSKIVELKYSQRGNPKIMINNLTYLLNKRTVGKSYWLCEKQSKGCRGRVITNDKNGKHFVMKTSVHNCQTGGKLTHDVVREETIYKKTESNNKIDNEMDITDFQFRHPFTCMVSGPTSSGKTYLVRRILKAFKHLFVLKTDELKVLWAYGQWQSLYTQAISDEVVVKYISGLPSVGEIKEDKPHVIIIDDLMNELGNNQKFVDLFTKGSHHMNISVIFISQNLFHQGKHMRTIGLNCHYAILMKSARGKAQLSRFAGDVFPGKSKYLLEAYEDATKEKPYSYIKVDMTQQTPEKYRITTNICPEDVVHLGLSFAPTVYVPK